MRAHSFLLYKIALFLGGLSDLPLGWGVLVLFLGRVVFPDARKYLLLPITLYDRYPYARTRVYNNRGRHFFGGRKRATMCARPPSDGTKHRAHSMYIPRAPPLLPARRKVTQTHNRRRRLPIVVVRPASNSVLVSFPFCVRTRLSSFTVYL